MKSKIFTCFLIEKEQKLCQILNSHLGQKSKHVPKLSFQIRLMFEGIP